MPATTTLRNAQTGTVLRRPQAVALLALAALILCLNAFAAMLELDEYLERAAASRKRGDWQSVASQLAQALNHPHLPSSGMERSKIHLDYGRALGVLCQYREAEKYMLLARDIARASGDSGAEATGELAAMSTARGDTVAAQKYLREAGSDGAPPTRVRAPPTPYGTRCVQR